MSFSFHKAERRAQKARIALTGPSGAGKTYSALRIAAGLAPCGRIAVIDTEHQSASLYAGEPGMPEFDVCELQPPFAPMRYVEAIEQAEHDGYTIIIVDSLSHAWAGQGGALEMVDTVRSRGGNSYAAWGPVGKQQTALVEKILASTTHMIVCMRSKMDYAQIEENGKKSIVKLGLAPIQRDGLEYEFTVVLDIGFDHVATSTKDRTRIFDGKSGTLTENTGRVLAKWLAGATQQQAQPAAASAPVAPAAQQGGPVQPPASTRGHVEPRAPEIASTGAGQADEANNSAVNLNSASASSVAPASQGQSAVSGSLTPATTQEPVQEKPAQEAPRKRGRPKKDETTTTTQAVVAAIEKMIPATDKSAATPDPTPAAGAQPSNATSASSSPPPTTASEKSSQNSAQPTAKPSGENSHHDPTQEELAEQERVSKAYRSIIGTVARWPGFDNEKRFAFQTEQYERALGMRNGVERVPLADAKLADIEGLAGHIARIDKLWETAKAIHGNNARALLDGIAKELNYDGYFDPWLNNKKLEEISNRLNTASGVGTTASPQPASA